jgi:hypothetical protein
MTLAWKDGNQVNREKMPCARLNAVVLGVQVLFGVGCATTMLPGAEQVRWQLPPKKNNCVNQSKSSVSSGGWVRISLVTL